MRRAWLSIALGLLAAGCHPSPEQQRRDTCTAFCECNEALPSAVERCIDNECLPNLPAASEECTSCVYENSQTCPALFSDCFDLCFGTVFP